VEGVHIDFVTVPCDRLAVDLQFEGGELVDGAGGSVFAGDPLGVEECERSGRDGDFEVGVEQAFGCFTSVEGDFDGSGRVVAGLGWG
jgi:hypothetical protein